MKRLVLALIFLFVACDKKSPTETNEPPTLNGTWESSITGTDYSSNPPVLITQQGKDVQLKLTFTSETWELYGTLNPDTYQLELSGVSASYRLGFFGTTTFLFNRIDGTLSVSSKDTYNPAYYTVKITR